MAARTKETDDHNEIYLLCTMVQGEKSCVGTTIMPPERKVRKAGSEVPLKKAETAPQPKAEQKKYGAWGPIYQNKTKFVDMHMC